MRTKIAGRYEKSSLPVVLLAFAPLTRFKGCGLPEGCLIVWGLFLAKMPSFCRIGKAAMFRGCEIPEFA